MFVGCRGNTDPNTGISASGRAWISTDVGIVRQIYDTYDTKIRPGIIISQTSDLLKSLRFLYENREIMKEMGLVGYMSAKKGFTWDTQMEQFENVFDEV